MYIGVQDRTHHGGIPLVESFEEMFDGRFDFLLPSGLGMGIKSKKCTKKEYGISHGNRV
jgi:hypothetical protein